MSELRELSFERVLSTANITADQGNFFLSYFSFLYGHGPVLCLRLVYYINLQIDCPSVWQITLANGYYENIHFAPRFISPRLVEIARLEPFTWKKATRLAGCLGQVDRVPRVAGLPCLACKRFDAFSKETYEKLALPG